MHLFVTDSIAGLDISQDTSALLIQTGLGLDEKIWQATPADLVLTPSGLLVNCQEVTKVELEGLIELEPTELKRVAEFKSVWLRKDPPFNTEYILHLALFDQFSYEHPEVQFVNTPSQVRANNEKLAPFWFPEYMPDTIVTRSATTLFEFAQKHDGKLVAKSLIGYGGDGVELIEDWQAEDEPPQAIVDLLEAGFVQAQEYLPEVYQGDLRVYICDGEVIGSLLRVPQTSFRANLHAGGKAMASELSPRQLEISQAVAEFLVKEQIFFAGIDFIGDYLTEINVTSPGVLIEANAANNVRLDEIVWKKLLMKIK